MSEPQTEEVKEAPRPTPSPDESEFKFFKILEDTIVGVIAFTSGLLWTFFHLIFRPSRVATALKSPSGKVFVPAPFTFLVISCFTFVLCFDTFFHTYFFLTSSNLAQLKGDIINFSLERMVTITLPVVLTVYFVGILLTRLAARNSAVQPALTAHVLCYSIGGQFFLTVAYMLVVAVFTFIKGWFLVLMALFFIPLTLIHILIAPLVSSISLMKNLQPSLFRKKRLILVPGLIISVILVLCGGIVTASLPSFVRAFEAEINDPHRAEIECVGSNVEISQDGNVWVSMALASNLSDEYYIDRSAGSLKLLHATEPHANNNSSTQNFNNSKPEAGFKTVSWSDNESPVMVLESKKIKWMIVSPQFNTETVTQLKDAVGRELTFLVTLKAQAFGRVEEAQDVLARCSAVISPKAS